MPSLLDVISPNTGLLGEDILQTGLTAEQKDLLRRRAYWQSGMATLGNVVDRLANPMRPPPMLDPSVSSGPARYQQMLMDVAQQQQAAQKLAAQRQAQTALQEAMAAPEADRVGKLTSALPSLIAGGYSSALEPLMNLAAFQQDQAVTQALQGAPAAAAPAGAPTAAAPAGAPTAAAPAGAPALAAPAGASNLSAEYSQLAKEVETLSRFSGKRAQEELKWRRERMQKIVDAAQEKVPTSVREAEWYKNASPSERAIYDQLNRSRGTNIQISTGEKATGKFGETLASKQAEAFSGVVEAAKSAPDLIAQANRLESVINNPNIILGPGADMRLAIASGLNALGADNNETLTNTQAAISSLADATLTNIKASGLGTGQGFTDKDLKFLERARSGNISFTKERLQDLVRIQRIAANNLVNKFNRELAGMPAETRATLAPAGIAPTYMASPMTPPLPAATEAIPAPSATPSAAPSGFKILSIRPGSAP